MRDTAPFGHLRALALVPACWVAGCAAPGEVVDPVEQLEQARLALAAERPERALEMLLEIDPKPSPGRRRHASTTRSRSPMPRSGTRTRPFRA